jgi:hypothetical protein
MAKPAKPAGRKPVENTKVAPKTANRQSKGPSIPTGKAPKPSNTPGGTPASSNWGQHLQ